MSSLISLIRKALVLQKKEKTLLVVAILSVLNAFTLQVRTGVSIIVLLM